ncbi:MAG: aminomethyl-transferring glycine dehydrogenase [Alphaproteobacteria bacterium]|nr:aminomethyl-transferring glycine dehydrogenase [Alphaproteobacteria bacterium]
MPEQFVTRHIGPRQQDAETMLKFLGENSLDGLIHKLLPSDIRRQAPMMLPAPRSEYDVLQDLNKIAKKNKVMTSLIGMGYYNTFTPTVITRKVLENPAWYTSYTPYQSEISQGRLEALLNFQTMVSDLTGMEIANASMLDEATAVAEAVMMAYGIKKNKGVVLIDPDIHPQSLGVMTTRATPLGMTVLESTALVDVPETLCCAVISYPGSSGVLRDIRPEIEAIHAVGGLAIVVTDLLALTILESPGATGADIVVGSAQRFGIPMGYGGPHPAFFATKTAHQRRIPGRIVGISIDKLGHPAYRLALQTREQHIRREKATSNICTAQALLAIIASFYGLWHGPDGLKTIAKYVHSLATVFDSRANAGGYRLRHQQFFDTVVLDTGDNTERLFRKAEEHGYNLRRFDQALGLSFDETHNTSSIDDLAKVFGLDEHQEQPELAAVPWGLRRNDDFMTAEIFHLLHSETQMLRYMRSLADKDLALDRTMIPLGSCTMKLNATTEMIPISWPEFSNLHPYAPPNQTRGYRQLMRELASWLCTVTGYAAVSLQPNAGSQGEYAGLLTIRRYHLSRNEFERKICLIPSSAHGTNPASAVMAGMKVVVVNCDDEGNIDLDDLKVKAEKHSTELAAMMITYPSTHGVFEVHIREVCAVVHRHGGQVYVDGANLNALIGLVSLPEIGADVSHLNLHKTFCIPHGGGGPGVGPIGVSSHLVDFLPGDPLKPDDGAVSAAASGSAGILPISWCYVAMMGEQGLRRATKIAILSANYIAKRLAPYYPVLYSGLKGYVAHECIIDIRPIKERTGISNEDITKRLMDYGLHAPTMSFPVVGTLMIEPTESETLEEMERFCNAMIMIHGEIRKVEEGIWPKDNNPLINAPHTAHHMAEDIWSHPYSRKEGVFPAGIEGKYWPPVSRVDNVFGDRNLVCSCPSINSYRTGTDGAVPS